MPLSPWNRYGGARLLVRFPSRPLCTPRSQNGKPVPGAGGLLSQSATFEVLTESQVYVDILSITRLPLLALTVRNIPSDPCRNRLCLCSFFVCTCTPSSAFVMFGIMVYSGRGCEPPARLLPYAVTHATSCVLVPWLFLSSWCTAFCSSN